MRAEHRLPEGRSGIQVWRRGNTVFRTAGPWTPTVHAFLQHLDATGFRGAPRVLGVADDGREQLLYIEGDVLADPAWEPGDPTPWPPWAQTEECLVSCATLLREFHAASRSFEPPPAAVWRQYPSPALGIDEIVCHGDIGTHNRVYRDGRAVAFIDWDGVRPNDPLVEFGRALWHYVPLGDSEYFAKSDFRDVPDLAKRVELFARTYGVDDADQVLWCLHQAKQRSVEEAKYWPIDPAGGAAVLRHVAATLEWLHNHRAELVAYLR